MSTNFRVKIEKMVYGGDGLGRLEDGRAIFVPFVLPDEEVLVAIMEDKGRFVRGRPLEILTSSPKRISPLCPHFGTCGGCHYQHLEYIDQLSLKMSVLADQLERIAHLNQAPVQAMISASAPWNYRNQLQFHPSPQGKLGFIEFSGRQVMEVHECHLPLPEINALWPLLTLEEASEFGRITFREDNEGEVLLLLEGSEENPPEMEIELPLSVAYLNPEDRLFMLAGQDTLAFTVSGKHFSVSAESFFQVNTDVAQKMLSFVLEHLPPGNLGNVLELYSGVGFFSKFLAERCETLTAIESSPSACYDFATNLEEFDNVSLYEGEVELILPSLATKMQTPDLVLLDPPRAGLHPKAREALFKLAPQKVIYISCDPSTLSRDLRAFVGNGYEMALIQPFDMFPQTYHLETVVFLQKINQSR